MGKTSIKKKLVHIIRKAHISLQQIDQTSQELKSSFTSQQGQKNNLESKSTRKHNIKMLNVMVNNIAGVDKHKRKLERILDMITTRKLDIFLGQEMNIQTRD